MSNVRIIRGAGAVIYVVQEHDLQRVGCTTWHGADRFMIENEQDRPSVILICVMALIFS